MSIPSRRSLHGRTAGITDNDQIKAKGGFVSGGDNKATVEHRSPDTFGPPFEDFLGHQKLDTGGFWRPILGTDTGNNVGGVGLVPGAHGGVASIRIDNSFALAVGGTGATTLNALVGTGRNFSAAVGRMRLAARVRANDTGVNGARAIFVGFSDDTGTVEFPIFTDTGTKAAASPSGDLAAKAANAFGLLCDTVPDTGLGMVSNRWIGVAVNGGTVTTAPVQADNGLTSRGWDDVEVLYDRDAGDTGGTAYFYVNGKAVGQVDAPVATSALLSPWMGIAPRAVDTGSSEMQVDWVSASQARDTGD